MAAAYAIAYVWVRGTPGQRLVAEYCILVPFWISVLTRAFGWVALLSNQGLINTWLRSIGFLSEPLALVRNEFGVVVGMMHFLIPFAVFPIASAMRAWTSGCCWPRAAWVPAARASSGRCSCR